MSVIYREIEVPNEKSKPLNKRLPFISLEEPFILCPMYCFLNFEGALLPFLNFDPLLLGKWDSLPRVSPNRVLSKTTFSRSSCYTKMDPGLGEEALFGLNRN
ncbi:hypothetical protein CDAR_172681 [Caerostris darwini]|uniref:Uncharacterized protein n=1 Tax=Caerostris darwini TaxID=1538125 RepID=A0AAV4MEN1_9ARAC|nr:hypothetical protein CDAR_172681 [Caerostris darwini]